MKMIKTIGYIILPVMALYFTACERHDLLDDIARIGQQTAYVDWTPKGTTVKAGTDVRFDAQYYTSGEPVDFLSVWYGVQRTIAMNATCPIVTGFNFSYSVNSVSVSRVAQEIIRYSHDETTWDVQKRAYQFTGSFPTSNTLAMVEWKEVSVFDQDKYDELFPDTFAVNFQNGLYAQLSLDKNISDYRKVMVSTGVLTTEQFDICLDSTYNENSTKFDKFVKPDKVEYLKVEYYTIPFSTLTYNTTESTYQISYLKSFTLNATFRVTDKKQVQGIADEYTIEIN